MRAIPGLLVRTVRKCIPTVAVVRGYERSYVAANPLPALHYKLGGRTASTNRRGILPSTAVLLYSCCVLLVLLLLRVCCGRELLGC